MASRRWRLDIYARGAVSTTAAPSYTLGSSYFRDAPNVGGQIVRAAECLVESNPWRVTIVDVGSTFTAKIADSSGRLHLLGRLCRLRASLNSTATSSYSSVTVGRLTDLALSPDVASWDLDISDERWVERQTSVFTKANSVSLVPYGNIAAFQGVQGLPAQKWRCIQKTGNMVCLRYDGSLPIPSSPGVAQLIVQDVKVGMIPGNTGITVGNFQTLRWRNTATATDYELGAFGDFFVPQLGGRPRYPAASVVGFWNDPLLGAIGDRDTPQEKLYVWLVWTASTPSLDTDVTGYLYAPTHAPTDDLPHLIGGSSGLHPATLVKQCYAGTHSPTTSLTVRVSTAAIDRWENEPAYGRVWFRMTAPELLHQFLDERIYGPYNVAPVVDSSGKISPTRMWLPTSTQLNVAGLASITSTNALTHPSWEHPSREAVTAIRFTEERYTVAWTLNAPAVPYFLSRPTTISSTRTHDTLSVFGRRELTFRLGSVTFPLEFTSTGGGIFGITGMGGPLIDKLANSIFQRFGDAPLYSNVEVSSAIDATTNGAILPGAFVKLKISTFPNAATLARGSTRVMQVLKRDITPLGRAFTLLDAGASLTPLVAPTVSLALSTASSRHAIKATVASLPAGARYEVQMAASSSTGAASPPVSSSWRWATMAYGSSTGLTPIIGSRASKTKYYARVRSSKPLRIGSAWSTASVSTVTASITAPSAFSVGSLTAGSGLAKWTNGSSLYGVEVMVDASSVATLASSNVVGTVPPMTTRYLLTGLNSNDTHKGGVRHFDPYGGRSAQATGTFATSTSYTVAPALRGLVIVEATA